MSEQIPAGWYPDPQDTTSEPRPERWWDGTGWTATTRPAPGAAAGPDGPAPAAGDEPTVLEGQVVGSGPTVRYPEYPPLASQTPAKARRRPSRPVVVAAAVAALAGVAVGSGITYLAMDGGRDQASARPFDGRGGYPFGNPGNGGGNGDAVGGHRVGGGVGVGGGNGQGLGGGGPGTA
ncbi:DUF2510 domain-containing protein, partial [Kitasatospora sp. NPDC059571]|uniref:DUF2510 domain-containing protein n=1 Tax=Kitasatospora sp. NPDC059571 TaxID=3346871 RepID=UPI00368D2603